MSSADALAEKAPLLEDVDEQLVGHDHDAAVHCLGCEPAPPEIGEVLAPVPVEHLGVVVGRSG